MLLKLIKNTELYTPQYEGKKDILIANDRIVKIEDEINIIGVDIQMIEGANTKCIPGIVDRHVHITGGGGEGDSRQVHLRFKSAQSFNRASQLLLDY